MMNDKLIKDTMSLLKDYLRKLEVDDFDSHAIEKMKETNRVIDELTELQEGM